jgi:hypothetical protein
VPKHPPEATKPAASAKASTRVAAKPTVRASGSQARPTPGLEKHSGRPPTRPRAAGSRAGAVAIPPSGAKRAPHPPERPSVENRRAAAKQPSSTGSNRTPKAALQASAAVEEIVYDAASGIKTLLLSDGSVREEPFDPVTLPMIKAAQGRAKVRIRIVNEDVPVEPRSPVEADPAAPSRSPTEDQSSAPVKPGSGMDE